VFLTLRFLTFASSLLLAVAVVGTTRLAVAVVVAIVAAFPVKRLAVARLPRLSSRLRLELRIPLLSVVVGLDQLVARLGLTAPIRFLTRLRPRAAAVAGITEASTTTAEFLEVRVVVPLEAILIGRAQAVAAPQIKAMPEAGGTSKLVAALRVAAVALPLLVRPQQATTAAPVALVGHPQSQGHQSLALAAAVERHIRLAVLVGLPVAEAVVPEQVQLTPTAATAQRTRAAAVAAISSAVLAPRPEVMVALAS
jgi:hypothetical protein